MIPQGKSLRFVLPALGAFAAFGLLSAAAAHSLLTAEGKSTTTDAAAAGRVERSYAKLPVSFEPNRGQTDQRVRFLARGSGYGLLLMKNEAVLSLRGKGSATMAVRMRALGANPDPEIVGERRLPGRVNYLRGRDPRGWQTGVPTFGAVRYRGLYPGIDQVFYGSQGRLEYDFVVAPAADPGRIGLAFSGAKALSLGRGGELLLEVAGGTLRQPRPIVYQEWGAKRRAVAARYVLDGDRVAFALGRYDRSRPLVIDPKIEYSTYLGGDSDERGTAIAVGGDGSAYVTGYTSSADFPAMPGVVQPAAPEPGAGYEDGYDVFVTKLNRSGSALEYSTYLGGRGADFGEDIAVDGRGRAYVVGSTQSTDFPTTPGAFQPGDPDPAPSYGGSDAFVTKLSSDGTYLKYSTYLGGRGQDDGYGIAVDDDERAYVTGFAGSADFPTTADAVQPRAGGTSDAFVTKLSREGTELKYSTYLGGSGSDSARDIAVDSDERAYVTGSTSGDFPTTRGAFRTEPGDGAVFVTKLSSEGTYLKYSTYLGGNESTGIAVDREQRAYVTGSVYTSGGSEAFVTKLSREGTDVKYSTYLGGGGEVYAGSIAVDLHGRAYVTGTAYVGRLPTPPDAVQPAPPEPEWDWNAFVAKLNTDGSTKYSTYLGEFGEGYAYGSGIAVDEGENFYVTGLVVSIPPDEEGWYTKFPTTSGAFQTAPGGWGDAFVTKFGD